MKILVTGATGFVGSHLAALLVKQGHDVHALVRKTSRIESLKALGIGFVPGSLEAGALPRRLPPFEAVIHLAGLIKAKSAAEFHDINAVGTARLIVALDRGALHRFVLVSSIAARGPNAGDHDLAGIGPVSEYGRSKLGGESAAREALPGVAITVFRPPIVYGPGDTATLTLFKLFKRGFIPELAGTVSKISFVYVEDLARVLASAVIKGCEPRPYYPEDGSGGYDREALTHAVSEAFGRRPRTISVPGWFSATAALATEFASRLRGTAPVFSRDKLKEMRHPYWFCPDPDCHRHFGLARPTPLAEGLKNTRKWYEGKGWL